VRPAALTGFGGLIQRKAVAPGCASMAAGGDHETGAIRIPAGEASMSWPVIRKSDAARAVFQVKAAVSAS